MPTTVQTCDNHIRHALGGPLNPLVPVIDVVNMTGEWLVALRPWNWLRRQQTPVTTVIGQNYVALPADFGRLLGVSSSSSGWMPYPTTYAEIDQFRVGNVTGGFVSGYVVGYVGGEPVLELYPTPTAAETFLVRYIAGWSDLTDDAEVVTGSGGQVPDYLRLPFLEAVRVIALGFEEGDNALVSQRLMDISFSDQMQRAMSRDGAVQAVLGPIQGGGAQAFYQIGSYPNFNTIAGPS